MKAAANTLIALTVLACLTALIISVYPGLLIDLLFFPILFAILISPVVGIVAGIALVLLFRKGKLQAVCVPWRRISVVLIIVACTYVLLKLYIPRRIAFAASRSAFEQFVAEAPRSVYGVPLKRRLGIYSVDEYASDPRGGVYFRVYAGADGIGPDTMSYGFVYKPNSEGTPFGASQYGVFYLGNEWYWFCASDDWY